MSSYDKFREMFSSASSEEKLAMIRSEAHHPLITIRGFSKIMQKLIDERKPIELPDDFGKWCKKIEESANELEDLIEASADKHRSVRQKEIEEFRENFNKSTQKDNEERWQNYQQDLPELKKYKNLKEAIEKTANRLGFSSLVSETKNAFLDDVYIQMPERYAFVSVKKSKLDSLYYFTVSLKWLSDWRNDKWEYYEGGFTSSLDETVTVLHHWLVEKEELQSIQKTFQWMSRGIANRNVKNKKAG